MSTKTDIVVFYTSFHKSQWTATETPKELNIFYAGRPFSSGRKFSTHLIKSPSSNNLHWFIKDSVFILEAFALELACEKWND